MNELSLFTGSGGGLLGSLLLGWRTIGYVEFNEYCQRVIRQRIIDGILHNAPIFGDIRAFLDSGCAELYRGVTDIVTGGFPCQPFSVAGSQLAAADDRNMWPETIAVISIVRPKLVFLENVPGLLSSGCGHTVIKDLQQHGYQVLPPLRLGAAHVGAPHQRNRVWICAYTESCREVANSRCLDEQREFPQRPYSQGWDEPRERPTRPQDASPRGWWETEPRLGRVVNGVAHRVDRLTAIGNGQVPAVVRAAFNRLIFNHVQ